MNIFESVGERLKQWAEQVRNARAEVIADITKETIKDLASKRFFTLPDKFISYIDDYERREAALQSIADYRDHFIHPFHVFCLGYQILKRWTEEWKEKRIERIPLNLTENHEIDYNLTVWFIASIYHDVGFPAEKLEVLFNDFFKTTVGRELRSQFDWSSVILANGNIKHIDRLTELFAKKTGNLNGANDGFEKWFHKRLLEDHDHGVLTALMLLNQGWKTEKEWDIAYEAALAIALHSYRRRFERETEMKKKKLLDFDIGQLAVEDFPLAFYLSYCDHAQEWGRKVLLELIKRISKSEANNSVQFLSGLNSKLKKPVPVLSQEQDSEDGMKRIKITVIIKYPTERYTRISGDKTLKDVFTEVAEKFESTWYLKNQKDKDFWIQGEDSRGIPIGYIYPAPQISSLRPTSPNTAQTIKS